MSDDKPVNVWCYFVCSCQKQAIGNLWLLFPMKHLLPIGSWISFPTPKSWETYTGVFELKIEHYCMTGDVISCELSSGCLSIDKRAMDELIEIGYTETEPEELTIACKTMFR